MLLCLWTPNQPEAIAEALDGLVFSDSLRDSFIQKGFEHYRRFSWKTCAEKTWESTILFRLQVKKFLRLSIQKFAMQFSFSTKQVLLVRAMNSIGFFDATMFLVFLPTIDIHL